MVVSRMLSNVSAQLSDFDFSLELSLEARKEHLSLRWLESVEDVRNGTNVVTLRKENKLTIDKLGIRNAVLAGFGVIQVRILLQTIQPNLSFWDAFL